MFKKNLEQIHKQLRAKPNDIFLEGLDIQNFRGIQNLSVSLKFPVSVLAGENACGKTTVLFACACAYKVIGAGNKDFVPSTLFPNLTVRGDSEISDKQESTVFKYYYTHNRKRNEMRWSKGKSWNKSGDDQPNRKVYLRTLANLTSPSEIRSVLQMGSGAFDTEILSSDLIAFAQSILPHKYSKISILKKSKKNLLVATRQDVTGQYSEFHMSAGERAILHISKDLSNLRDALVLIDEIEAGLHPFTQQQIMLELQRLALRNNLQIIVTSHSAVVLDCVPIDARIFLERTENNVIVKNPYKDIIQKAFYGQSIEKISVLCEDEIGEAFLNGVMDYLNPKLGLVHSDMVIGRDTGKDEFKQHIQALGKFQQLRNFIFVLDGDAKHLEGDLIKYADDKFKITIKPLFLPGDVPEVWAWRILQDYISEYASELGMQEIDLKRIIGNIDSIFSNATDKPTNIAKNKFFTFCKDISRDVTGVIRLIARKETERQKDEIKIFVDELELQISTWQTRG